jgi:hypothetical protein
MTGTDIVRPGGPEIAMNLLGARASFGWKTGTPVRSRAYMGLVRFPSQGSPPMPQPLIVSIPHRLGRDEATRCLKSGLETARTKLRQDFAIEEETWTDSRLQFRVRALAQAANGAVRVAEVEEQRSPSDAYRAQGWRQALEDRECQAFESSHFHPPSS